MPADAMDPQALPGPLLPVETGRMPGHGGLRGLDLPRSSRPQRADRMRGRRMSLRWCPAWSLRPSPRFLGTRREAGPPAWLASLPAVRDEGHAVCLLSFCTLWRQGNSPFCVNHKSRWEFAGRPDTGKFIVICESKGDDRFDFRPLGGRRQIKLELQYALQSATMSVTSTPQAGPSAAPSPWPRPAASRPCWTGRPGAGRRSSTRI